MAISEALKELYSSNTSGVRFYHTLELSHSQFTKTFYLVQDTDNHDWELEDTSTKTFEAFGFDLKLPDVGEVQQDLSIVFDNVGREIITELERASEVIEEPIVTTYRVYIDGSDTAQMPPLQLVLTNIVADTKAITCVATRPDLYKKLIPTGNQSRFDQRFKGLYL